MSPTPQERTDIIWYVNESQALLHQQARCLDTIRALHNPDRIGAQQTCRECLKPWPCPTAHATVE